MIYFGAIGSFRVAFEARTGILEYAGRLSILDPGPARLFATLSGSMGHITRLDELLADVARQAGSPGDARRLLLRHIHHVRGALADIHAPIRLRASRRDGHRILGLVARPPRRAVARAIVVDMRAGRMRANVSFAAQGRAREPGSGRTMALGTLCLALGLTPAHAGTPPGTLSNVFTSQLSIVTAQQTEASKFANARGGANGLLTVELPDDYDAVQIGVVNQFANSWGVSRLAVSPSANYGGDPVIGAAPYDLDGQPLATMLPVHWGNRGADSAPPGTAVVALATSAPALPGTTTLSFASTASAPAYGGLGPGVGWTVADGIGCIPAGATVAAITPTTITLSASVVARGCGLGQSIYFAPVALGPLAHNVAAASSTGVASVTFSDWIPMHSLPRSDGGFATGGRVTGAGVAVGTTLAAIGYTQLALSQPLAASMAAQSPLDISYDRALVLPTQAGSVTLPLNDASGTRVGQTVTGGGAIDPATHVVAIEGNTVALDRPLRSALAPGAIVSFTNRTWLSLPAAAGNSAVSVPSTSRRPLLHVRYFAKPGAPISVSRPACVRSAEHDAIPCEAPLGLPPTWTSAGGQTADGLPIDGINFVSRIGAGVGSPHGVAEHPTFFVRFLGRHAGGTLLECGGFQMSGSTGSVSGEASFGRIAAALATELNPSVPVAATSVASIVNSTSVDAANCTHMIDAIQPTMVMVQDFSDHNNDTVAQYRARVKAVAEHALARGVQPIIYLAYVEQAARVGGITVASDVVDGTVVPLRHGLNPLVSGSPSLISGAGIPDDTTAILTPGAWQVTLSRPVTLAAGSVLFFKLDTALTSTSGTSIALEQPSFATLLGALVQAPGLAAPTKIDLHAGNPIATLGAAVTLAPDTTLDIATDRLASLAPYSEAARWFLSATDAWASTRIDAFDAIGSDPAHPGRICPGCSTQGSYVNDWGNVIIASLLLPVLQRITGQAPAP